MSVPVKLTCEPTAVAGTPGQEVTLREGPNLGCEQLVRHGRANAADPGAESLSSDNLVGPATYGVLACLRLID